MGQVIDKGRIVAAVDKFQSKENGQPVFNQDNTPKMQNKWMAIGEATKWKNDDGSESTTEKIYLHPVGVNGAYFEQRTFWDSSDQQKQQLQPQVNPAPMPDASYQQPQQGYPQR